MCAVKRVVVWLLETVSEALLLSLFLVLSSGSSDPQRGYARDLSAGVVGVAGIFMFGSGYLLTSAILRLLWRNHALLIYALVAAALISTHLLIFFRIAGGLTLPEQTPIVLASACIAFVCTLVGGWLLQKWMDRPGRDSGLLHT
jgi:hypothetical protein